MKVADLNLACNFDIGYFSTRTSRTCDGAATSVVYDPDAPVIHLKARCDKHHDQLDKERRGQSLDEVTLGWEKFIWSAPRYTA